MQIKTVDGTESVASAGVGGAGLGLGIAGTALGLLNGGLNNLFGANNGYCSPNSGAAQCMNDTRIIADLQSEIELLKSQKYTDEAILKQRDREYAFNEKFVGYVIDLDKRVSAIETAGPLREQLIQQQISCCCNSANAAIAALQNTVNGLTKTVIPSDNICPEPMAKYNSWTAPTTATTTTP